MNIITIIILLVMTLMIFLTCEKKHVQENFSSDEAIQNIASLYNQANLTVTNFTSTGNTTLKGNASGATHFPYTDGNNYLTSNNNILRGGPTTIQGNLNVDNAAIIKGSLSAGTANFNGPSDVGGTCFNCAGTDSANYISGRQNIIRGGPTTVQSNLQVDGSANFNKGIQSIVLDAPDWRTPAFVNQIKSGNYFSRNSPDGTTLRFFFIFPSKGASNTHVWHGVAVKLGQQFLLYEITPQHTNVGNLWSSSSNNGDWRGNL